MAFRPQSVLQCRDQIRELIIPDIITSQISCSGLNLSVKNLLIVVTNLIFCESFMRFTNKYPVEIEYGIQRHDNLFLQMLSFDNYVICNINRDDVNTIVSPCCVKIENIAKLPLHKQNKLILPLFQKSQTRTQSEVMLPLSQQASGEKAGVGNHEAYHSGNLPHIPKLTSSSHVHPFGIKNPKNHCFINVILQFIYSVLRSTQQKIHINNCVEGKISECPFDTAHKTPSAQEVETLKLQLYLQ